MLVFWTLEPPVLGCRRFCVGLGVVSHALVVVEGVSRFRILGIYDLEEFLALQFEVLCFLDERGSFRSEGLEFLLKLRLFFL